MLDENGTHCVFCLIRMQRCYGQAIVILVFILRIRKKKEVNYELTSKIKYQRGNLQLENNFDLCQ